MEIACGPAGCIDHAVDASHLFGVQPDYGRDFLRLETLVLGIQAQVHAVVGQGKIKLLLRLVQRIRVGRRRPLLNLLRNAEICRQLIDLCFVEVSDRFQIGSAVAILDKEALIIFETVRSAYDRIVEAVRVVILHHLASALFEIGRSHHAEVGIQCQPGFGAFTLRRFDDDRENRVRASVHLVRQDDFALVAFCVLRYDLADGVVTALVTARGSQNASNVLDLRSKAE